MLFCKKCGNILVPHEKKKKLVCRSCGSKEKASGKGISLKEKVKPTEAVEVVEQTNMKVLPKIEEECPKCHHPQAYFWTVQTRASDEAETRFFECIKCHNRWRKYD